MTALKQDFDASRLKTMTVLCVDDDPLSRMLAAAHLQKLGAGTILEAENGQEGLDVLAANPVDLIMTDGEMPVLDGLKFIAAVRADAKLNNVPVMIVSSSEHHRNQGLALGANAAADKPLDPQKMQTLLAQCFPPAAQTPSSPAPSGPRQG